MIDCQIEMGKRIDQTLLSLAVHPSLKVGLFKLTNKVGRIYC
jgi:hypothetical protein